MKVLFFKEDKDILAIFPDEPFNKQLYGNSKVVCYSHIGQHSSCYLDYYNSLNKAKYIEYLPLLKELWDISYVKLELSHW